MRKLKLFIGVVSALALASIVAIADPTAYQNIGYNARVGNETALAVDKEIVVDTNGLGVKAMSAQINFGYSVDPGTVTAYDGRVSTTQITISSATALSSATAQGRLTVSSNSALAPAYAQNVLIVSSNGVLAGQAGYDIMVITQSVTSLTGSTITMNDVAYREGIEWRVMSDSQTTAINISTSLTSSLISGTTFAGDLAGVRFTAVQFGTHSLLYDLTSSTPNGHQIYYSSFIGGVNNTSFTLNGITLRQGTDWTKDAFTTNTVLSIMEAIRDNTSVVSCSTAGGSGDRIFLTATATGTAGNAYTLISSSQAALTVGASGTFYGGTAQENSYFTINGSTYTQGIDWKMTTTASGTAVSIAFAINRSSMTRGVKADAVGAVIYSTPIAVQTSTDGVITVLDLWGTQPNSWTTTSSTPTALLSSATFSGGRNRATLTVNGVAFRNGIEWLTGASSLTATTNLAAALKANTTVSAYISFSSNGVTAVIYASSVYVNQPFLIVTSTQGALEISSITLKSSDGSAYGYFQGGLASDISTTTEKITKANSFTAGLAVSYSTGAGGNTLVGLTVGVTYYIRNPTATEFYLARTASGAIVSSPTVETTINLQGFANLTTTGAATYIFTPLLFTGTSTMTWTRSNDGVNYTTMTISNTVVWASVSSGTANTLTFNFCDFNYRYLRLHTKAAPTGGLRQEVYINGKQ